MAQPWMFYKNWTPDWQCGATPISPVVTCGTATKKNPQFSHNCNTKILDRAILDSGGLRSTTSSVFEVLSQFDRPNQDKEAGLQLASVSCLPEPQVTHGTSRKNPHQVSGHTPSQVLARKTCCSVKIGGGFYGGLKTAIKWLLKRSAWA